MPPSPAADRNLLFGILALQMDFVSRDALIAAMNAWVLDKARPLGQVLVEQQALRPEQGQVLDQLVAMHLECHDNDPEKSLAAVAVPTPLRDELHRLADGDLQASLAAVPSELPSTVAYVPGPDDGLRYQVLRPHARGGLGQVFVALDQELHREVALKEIDARHADDPPSRGRFVREAEITGGLEHPGVVPVYGLGRHPDGRPYYAMRFIRGETLKDAIARFHQSPRHALAHGDLDFRRLLSRFVAVCNAVAYAHSRGVIHRDLKPSNVMLGPYGETLVVDWGLAKAVGRGAAEDGDGPAEPTLVPVLSDTEGATRTGAALGTPAYMSPEQAAGRLDELGPASDVYGLGATLYALLTGRPPVEGKDAGEVLARVQRGDWPAPRQVRPAVPPALDAVCRKALGREPGGRYASALDLAAEVERWLADEPVAAWREPWAVRGRRWLGKHRTLVTAAAAAAVVALIGLASGLVLLAAAAQREVQARNKAEDNEKTATEQRNEARRNLYIAQMNLVQREYEANNLAHVRELLEAQSSWPPGAEDMRGFEWYYWNQLAHQELRTLEGHAVWVTSVAFSPDGRRIASCGGDKANGVGLTAKVWDVDSGQETLTIKGFTNFATSVAFSPDGRWLASGIMGNAVGVWDAASGQKLFSLSRHTDQVYSVAFSPDGRRIASAGIRDNTVKVWDVARRRELYTLNGHPATFSCVAFSPDGRRLAGSRGDMVKVWDAASGQELLSLKGHTGEVWSVAFSPDGRRLASGSRDNTVKVWDVARGQETLTLKGHTGAVGSVAFSPDGRRLASGSQDNTVKVWDVFSGQGVLTFKGHTAEVRSVAYSPDGRHLASASGDKTVKLWDVSSGQEPLILKNWPRVVPVGSVTFTPDGRHFARPGPDNVVKAWEAASGREGFLFNNGASGLARSVAISPDGRRLASGSEDGTVQVWDTAGGQQLLTLKGHARPVGSVAISPDGQRLASASRLDNTAKVWDVARGRELFPLKGHTAWVRDVCFSPDGRHLASGSADGTVKLWDAASGQELLTLQGHTDQVLCVTFSLDGRRLASGSQDNTVKVWDVARGQETLTLKGHTRGVFTVAFSPDGRRLAGADRSASTVKVWDTVSGQETLTFGGERLFGSLAFSPDGRRLALNAGNIMESVWEAEPASADELRRREIVNLVRDLFESLALRSDVLACLRRDPTLDAPTREAALQLAEAVRENPKLLNAVARNVVKTPGGDREAYALALRQAEAAVHAAPGNGECLNTMGVAHYRLGEYAKALEAVQQSEKRSAATPLTGTQAADLAFLAMARQQLGHQEQAQAALARLRELMKQPGWEKNAEAQDFLREAEGLIGGKAAGKKE
jgi:WD40 repeat protein